MAAIEVRACQWSTVPTIDGVEVGAGDQSSRKSLYLVTSSGLNLSRRPLLRLPWSRSSSGLGGRPASTSQTATSRMPFCFNADPGVIGPLAAGADQADERSRRSGPTFFRASAAFLSCVVGRSPARANQSREARRQSSGEPSSGRGNLDERDFPEVIAGASGLRAGGPKDVGSRAGSMTDRPIGALGQGRAKSW